MTTDYEHRLEAELLYKVTELRKQLNAELITKEEYDCAVMDAVRESQ